MIRTRFAPSPTGRLHVGNIYIALSNWLFARKYQGEFILRYDDTDTERSTTAFKEGIAEDLQWLGLDWDRQAAQSVRLSHYDQAIETLRKRGRLYPCYETAEELSLKRKVQLQSGKPPVYDRAALKLSAEQRAELEASGREPHWRFLLEPRDVEWVDLTRGPQRIDCRSQSDPVLRREDGTYLYTLPSTLDDIEMQVTHVIRGNDHVTNTGVQIQIFEALGARPPQFAHLPLLVDAAGEGLSKRLGSLSIASLREQGIEPIAILSYLSVLGTGEPVHLVDSPRDLLDSFDLSRFGKASPHFDAADLERLTARLFHNWDWNETLRRKLTAQGLPEVGSVIWEAVRTNLSRLDEITDWQAVIKGPIDPIRREEDAFYQQAVSLLPPLPWDDRDRIWKDWTQQIKSLSGRSGKALFLPLRLALTGREAGPEMHILLPLIGRDKAIARLRGERC